MGWRVTLFGFLAVVGVGGWVGWNGRLEAEPPAPPRASDPIGIAGVLKRQGYHVVPLERRANSNYLWLTAQLAGKEVRFVVDTAAGATTLDVAVAKRLQLTLLGTDGKASGIGGSDITQSATPWPTLKLGNYTTPLAFMTVVDLGHVNKGQEQNRADRIDGILGADVLTMYSAVIDYTAPALYLLDPAIGHKEIQGEWRGVDVEHNGGRYPADHAKLYRFTFDGLTFRFAFDGKGPEYRIRLDPHAAPKQMTWYSSEGATVQAIYEIKDGRLRMAFPIYDGDNRSARPTSFTPPKENGFAVVTLERVPSR